MVYAAVGKLRQSCHKPQQRHANRIIIESSPCWPLSLLALSINLLNVLRISLALSPVPVSCMAARSFCSFLLFLLASVLASPSSPAKAAKTPLATSTTITTSSAKTCPALSTSSATPLRSPPPSPPPPPYASSLAFNSILQTRRNELASIGFTPEQSKDVGLALKTIKNTYVLHSRVREWDLAEIFEPQLELEHGPKDKTVLQDMYELKSQFAGGSCGEVWLAYTTDRQHRYVLKRVFGERGERFILAGLREVYFGTLLKNEPRVARFVEAFNRTSESNMQELWLVFEDEGRSLKSFLYRTTGMGLIKPSEFWLRLRKQQNGPSMRRELARHLVLGIETLARRGIVHRDIKPGNIFITPPRLVDEAPVKIGDFGSAIDDYTLSTGMFGPAGPSREEHTKEYEPPEAAASADPYTTYFDSWSLGVTCLEILLGSDQFFSSPPSNPRRRSRKGKSSSNTDNNFGLDNIVNFNKSVTMADSDIGRGFYDDPTIGPLELDFVFRLLQPLDRRMAITQALDHPYISGGSQSPSNLNALQFQCSCGRLFSAHSACHAHAAARGHIPAGEMSCMVHQPRLAEQCSSFGIIVRNVSRNIGLCGDRGGRAKMEDAGGAQGASLVVADG